MGRVQLGDLTIKKTFVGDLLALFSELFSPSLGLLNRRSNGSACMQLG